MPSPNATSPVFFAPPCIYIAKGVLQVCLAKRITVTIIIVRTMHV